MKKPRKRKSSHPTLHILSTAGIAVIALAACGALAGCALYSRSVLQSPQMAAVITSVLVDLANDDRKDEDLGTLTVNPKLVAAAQAKADDMAAKGYFAHTSPDGRSSWSWFKDQGYSFAYAGENLAVNFSDSADVEEAWMDSPTHRANILNGKFTEIGIATAVGEYKGKKTTFVVQMFGTPSAKAATAPIREITNAAEPEEIAVATTREVLGTQVEEVPAKAEPAAAAAETDAPPDPAPVVTSETTYAPAWGFLATAPKTLLRNIYLASALALLLALITLTGFEFKKHHFRHMYAAAFLIVLMGGLFVVADTVVFRDPLIAQADHIAG